MNHLDEKLEVYRDLWNDRSGRFVLVQSIDGSLDYATCLIYDMETKTGLLEEDDELYLELQRRLSMNGVPMLAKTP